MNIFDNNKVILLYSGGVDSTVLLHYLLFQNYEVFPLYIDYGQVTFNGEIKAININLPDYLKERLYVLHLQNIKEIGMGSLIGNYPKEIYSKEEWYNNEFFPNRNLIFLSLAASYGYKIGSRKVAIGVVGEHSYSDTTLTFLKYAKKVIGVSLSSEFEIIAPYSEKPRTVVIEDAHKFSVSLEQTFSCNSLGDRHCLLCTSCYEREQALEYAKMLKKENPNNINNNKRYYT
jgi:7-cyano-7-deazaguanine synthase